MGEACLQLPAAAGGESRGCFGRKSGRVLEGVSKSAEARRSGEVFRMAVPHRAQRGVFAAAQTAAGKRACRRSAGGDGTWITAGRVVAGGGKRAGAPERRSARSGSAEDLSGVQV